MNDATVDLATARRARAVIAEALGSLASVGPEPGEPSAIGLVLADGRTYRLRLIRGDRAAPRRSGYDAHLRVLEKRSERPRQDENFVDLRRGAIRLFLPGLLVDRESLPLPPLSPGDASRLIDPFADRTSRVVRVLLSGPARRRWATRELAEAAGVDPATVSRAARALRADQLLMDDAPGQGRTSRLWVPDPKALLAAWTRAYDWRDNTAFAFVAPVGDPRRFLRRLPKILGPARMKDHGWALTLQPGAALEAPHADWEKVHVYLAPTRIEEVAPRLVSEGWSASEDGRLVLLKPYYKDSVWFGMRQLHGLPVVSTVQLVLDLWEYPVRGREQAEHLIDGVLRSRWKADAADR